MMRLFCVLSPALCERHRPFVLARPATTSAASTEGELSINPMGQLDSGDRDGRVPKRREAGHRRAAALDRPVLLLNQVAEIFIRLGFDRDVRFVHTPRSASHFGKSVPSFLKLQHVAHNSSARGLGGRLGWVFVVRTLIGDIGAQVPAYWLSSALGRYCDAS
jgi:hypothetical protein